MKTVEELIVRVRRETRNANTGLTTAGASISDAEFVDKLNDGQELAVELISGLFSTFFERTKVYTMNTTQDDFEILTLPTSILLFTRVSLVEYSYSGRADNYVNIKPVDVRERYTGTNYLRSIPGYIVSGNQIILSEKANNNGAKVRVTYELAPPRLDVAKAVVATGSRSGTDFSGTYTVGSAHADVTDWVVNMPVSVIDISTNTVLIRDGRFSSLNTGTGAFTIDLTNATYDATTVDAATATNLRLIEGGAPTSQSFLTMQRSLLLFTQSWRYLGETGQSLPQELKSLLRG